MEIEINSNLNNHNGNDDDSEYHNNINNNNNINSNNRDYLSVPYQVNIQENKISLVEKANIKFGLFCDLLEKCLKQKAKVKSK